MEFLFGAVAVYWLAMIVLFVVFAFVLPFAVFTMARNLKRLRVQFERLNDSIESGRVAVTFAVPATTDEFGKPRIRAGAGIGSLK